MNTSYNFTDFDLPLENHFSLGFDQPSLPIHNSPERIDFSIICFCIKGTAEIEVDFNKYHIEAGTIISIFPPQVIEEKHVSQDFSIIYIKCSQDFLNNVLFRFPPEFILFLKNRPVFKAPDEIFQTDMEFLDRLKTKYEDINNICRSSIIIHMIRIHYLEMFNILQHRLQTNMIQHSRKTEIMGEFVQLLMHNYLIRREVQFYASQMNITPKYLSIITQDTNGITAKKYIDNFVITEIKLRLKSSTQSIQEIAEMFHFPDPSFFTKYFKHHTNLTPKVYRMK